MLRAFLTATPLIVAWCVAWYASKTVDRVLDWFCGVER